MLAVLAVRGGGQLGGAMSLYLRIYYQAEGTGNRGGQDEIFSTIPLLSSQQLRQSTFYIVLYRIPLLLLIRESSPTMTGQLRSDWR